MHTAEQIFQALADLVPADNGTAKVYPHYADETAERKPPYIIYNDAVSSVAERTLDGHTGHERVRVQIDVYAEPFEACRTLANQVIWQMETVGFEYINQQSLNEPDSNLYRRSLDFYGWQTNCN